MAIILRNPRVEKRSGGTMVDLFEGTIAFEASRCTLKETWTWPLQQKTTTAMSLTKDRNEAKYSGQPVFVDLLRSSPRNERVALSKFHAASRKLSQCHLPPSNPTRPSNALFVSSSFVFDPSLKNVKRSIRIFFLRFFVWMEIKISLKFLNKIPESRSYVSIQYSINRIKRCIDR